MNEIKLLKHQAQFISAIKIKQLTRYFFFCGGYRSGKSFTICQLIIWLASIYQGQDVFIGLGAPTISLIYKTFLLDLQIILKTNDIFYILNKQDNTLIIGTVKFFLIAIGFPVDIYGYTFNAFLCDEIDELPQHHGETAFTAIDERCSRQFPDGRQPFCAFFSTVQGYKTVYKTVRNLIEKDIKYYLVRGLTKDNIYNHPTYYENRYKLYNELERMAFLEGKFVNLITGRVYPEFIEEKHVIEHFVILPTDEIYIGQDLNIGWSKAVAMIIRENKIYIINNWSFDNIGNAPIIIRNAYPENDIYLYPDSSGKMIMQGYKAEFEAVNIHVMQGVSNPSILTRIFYVNKLFKTNRLFLFKNNDKVAIDLKTRGFDKAGQPEKGGGEKDPSHLMDGLEYGIYRIIQSKPIFWDLKNAIKIKE